MKTKFYLAICFLLALSLTIGATPPNKKTNKKAKKKSAAVKKKKKKKNITMVFRHQVLGKCLKAVAEKGGISYVLAGDIGEEPITAVFKKTPAHNAMKALLLAAGSEFDYVNGVFVIAGRNNKRVLKKIKIETEILEHTLELLEMEQKRRKLENILERQERQQQKQQQQQPKKTQPKKTQPKKTQQSKIVSYDFTVNIVSGSLYKKVYKGAFSYDSSKLKNKGKESLSVQNMHFVYQGHKYTGFDATPALSFVDGKLKNLTVVGGKQRQRFGFNAGFNRGQFGRPSESFIPAGKPYFGYLNRHTYVDGAGTISYKKRP